MDEIDELWERRVAELERHTAQHEHCNVHKRYQQLANWVKVQRRTKDAMDSEQHRRLNELGFEWNPDDAVWERRFAELERHKEQHGDCNVPNG